MYYTLQYNIICHCNLGAYKHVHCTR